MCPPEIHIEGEVLPRKAVHEAGHAVVAAELSDDPVRIEDGLGTTDEGFSTDAMCICDWKRGANESLDHLFERRIAHIYGSAIAEAVFDAPDAVEARAIQLWHVSERFKGDRIKAERMFMEEMPSRSISPDRAKAIRSGAWEKAICSILMNRNGVVDVARDVHAKGSLSNEEIRALLKNSQQGS
jgi:hypothetical protein